MDDETRLTERIIGGAIEVHRHLGPGLLESTYERALCVELTLRELRLRRQVSMPVDYKGHVIGRYQIDVLVEDAVVVEVKSAAQLSPVFQAQLLAYLRVARKRIGLLLNFNAALMRHGIQRVVLT